MKTIHSLLFFVLIFISATAKTSAAGRRLGRRRLGNGDGSQVKGHGPSSFSSSSLVLSAPNGHRLLGSGKSGKSKKNKRRSCQTETATDHVEFVCSSDKKKDTVSFMVDTSADGIQVTIKYKNDDRVEHDQNEDETNGKGHHHGHYHVKEESEYTIHFNSIIEYIHGTASFDGNDNDDENQGYKWDMDEIPQTLSLDEFNAFTAPVLTSATSPTDTDPTTSTTAMSRTTGTRLLEKSGSSSSSSSSASSSEDHGDYELDGDASYTFSVTTKDNIARFDFTLHTSPSATSNDMVANDENEGANDDDLGSKMKIDVTIANFPWKQNNTYVSLLSTVEASTSIRSYAHGSSKKKDRKKNHKYAYMPPTTSDATVVDGDSSITTKTATPDEIIVDLIEYHSDNSPTDAQQANVFDESPPTEANIDFTTPNDDNEDSILDGLPFGFYTWVTTYTSTAEADANNDENDSVMNMTKEYQVVATSPVVEADDVTTPDTDEHGDSTSTSSQKQSIAFSFMNSNGADSIYWDPEAGVGYVPSTSDASTILSSRRTTTLFKSGIVSLSLVVTIGCLL
mmetsp:Transcript_18191/g.25635  ORF Transcript_18191/g.25635 Transcript_18191/m.25635 type:complete len:566 (+) Transcript_18191:179-1876(+)